MSESLPLRLPRPQPREERQPVRETALERGAYELAAWAVVGSARWRARRHWSAVQLVRNTLQDLDGIDDAGLRTRARQWRSRPSGAASTDGSIEALALAVEAAARTLGIAPYDCQIAGAHALMSGAVAEMETGEGKTLTSALAAAAMALGGIPVHVVTVNEYLAQRDAALLAPLYQFLGLTVGLVLSSHEDVVRRTAYAADVVHVTAKDLAFDYMRDRLETGRQDGNLFRQLEPLKGPSGALDTLRLRGLSMAIIDEIDSVLIDEGRQPLVISQQSPPTIEHEDLVQASVDAVVLQIERDYTLSTRERRVDLTPNGQAHVTDLAEGRGARWRVPAWREELVRQALAARHFYHRDEDYVIQHGAIGIVDEHTGRMFPDRSWSAGLQEMIELKEGVAPRGGRTDIARLTYQRFFRRYRRLAGMSGTAREVARELWAVYRLPTVRLPPHRPSQRVHDGSRFVESDADKWRALAEHVDARHRQGRPVLVGTRTVSAARAASAALSERGLAHSVLSADQDLQEAAVIAQAGQPGRITIATNMAGRGTDIRLGNGVAEAGGLHVVMSEVNEAGRIDRQLVGRCARQGDPGSWEAILSLADPLLAKHLPRWLWRTVGLLPWGARYRLGNAAVQWAQRRAERLHSRMRSDLMRADYLLDDMIAFSGRHL